MVWDASRGWTVAWLAVLAVQGLLPAATVYLTRALVDRLAAAVGAGDGWSGLRPAAPVALTMGGVMLLGQLLAAAAGWIRAAQGEAVADHVTDLVHRQCARLDLGFFDSAQYFDRLHRARLEASHRPLALVANLGSLLQSGVTLVAMAGVLLPCGAWVPALLLLSTLPALRVALHYRAREHQYQQRIAPHERRIWYYGWLLTARETAPEIRQFDLSDRLRSLYRALRLRLRRERLARNRDEALAQLVAGALALLTTGGVMAWMAWRAAQGRATLGELAMFYAAFSQGQGLLRTILGSLAQLHGNGLFLRDLLEFLALDPRVVDPPDPQPWPAAAGPPGPPRGRGPALRFRDVSFAYPGDRPPVLNRFSLEVPAGQTAALVGPNGAGKSTLVKLLCRFYDPAAGGIEVDGVDLRRMAVADLRRHLMVLFQDPIGYAASAAENITLDFRAADASPTQSAPPAALAARVREAARAAGADGPIEGLPHGYNTMLSTWFEGGTDLSTGEWQRVALARAFLRQAPLIVLDEPSSAMDPWAERDWVGRLGALTAGRTTLIVTHRFTTAMLADQIHVMEAGRIVESGSHRQLLALGGRYARSWRSQMHDGRTADRAGRAGCPA